MDKPRRAERALHHTMMTVGKNQVFARTVKGETGASPARCHTQKSQNEDTNLDLRLFLKMIDDSHY